MSRDEATSKPEPGPQPEALEAAIARLTEVVEGVHRLVEIRVARARVDFRERSFRALGWVLLVVFLVSLIVASAVFLARGFSGLMGALFQDTPWAGDLAAGIGMIMAALIISAIARSRVRHRGLEKMRSRYTETALPREKRHD